MGSNLTNGDSVGLAPLSGNLWRFDAAGERIRGDGIDETGAAPTVAAVTPWPDRRCGPHELKAEIRAAKFSAIFIRAEKLVRSLLQRNALTAR